MFWFKDVLTFSLKDSFAPQDDPSVDCTSDQLLARMLQQKFDDEYCAAQPRDGRTINHPVHICPESDDDDQTDEVRDYQAEHIAAFDKAAKIGPRGYANINGVMVTKHDPEISGHRNTQKITDNMPLSFPCGDAHTSAQPLSNKIYNELRRSAFKGNMLQSNPVMFRFETFINIEIVENIETTENIETVENIEIVKNIGPV